MTLERTEQLVRCDNVADALEGLTLEDRLSVLGSVIAGFLRAGLNPGQRIIHLHTLYLSISAHLGDA